MAATNSTTNLGLPQWVATDKPERTDFNAAFDAIDTTVAAHLADDVNPHSIYAKITQEDWIEPTLLNGWDIGDVTVPLRYRKNTLGIVEIQGQVAGGVMAVPIFILPSGYYSTSNLIKIPCTSDAVFGYAYINTSGHVIPITGSSAWFAFNTTFSPS